MSSSFAVQPGDLGPNITIPQKLHELGTVCSLDQWILDSQSGSRLISCLTRGQSIGMTLTATAGFISVASVLALYIMAFHNALTLRRDTSWREVWREITWPDDLYMLALFTFDILQALGAVLDVRWINRGIVSPGGYCRAQGIIQQIGETGVAMTTGVLAIHTFLLLWCRTKMSGRFASIVIWTVMGIICTYLLLYSLIGAFHAKLYEAPSPYWCWIAGKQNHYLADKIMGEYLWLWLTLVLSVVLYTLLWLLLRGNVDPEEGRPWKVTWQRRPSDHVEKNNLGILAYPVVYSAIILPLSVVRWITFATNHVPSAATFFVVTLFNLSGLVNVLMLLLVRSKLLLFGAARGRREGIRNGTGTDNAGGVPPVPSDSDSDRSAAINRLGMAGAPGNGSYAMEDLRRRSRQPSKGIAPSIVSSNDEEEASAHAPGIDVDGGSYAYSYRSDGRGSALGLSPGFEPDVADRGSWHRRPSGGGSSSTDVAAASAARQEPGPAWMAVNGQQPYGARAYDPYADRPLGV
ncbi:hypothetical protein PUNSTDRAFT_118927 [Punctularia strigosozonata HHB-11173 SS5]|uniref:uncharacterized protein n=1 Tax=Punctularia strigosozonata (strain HHB-11173) TaxID=741275 RepID=UPI0004417DE2|nr:uncharacterized protein PUNSTDRAFT_118927 [Punctularia strigosozonata HHB-11173 SS5]EIN11599.1 hypothetical protein PUNSTDRAFT_118927 [Punctularia strigosozonata HHB-11173 SS5]